MYAITAMILTLSRNGFERFIKKIFSLFLDMYITSAYIYNPPALFKYSRNVWWLCQPNYSWHTYFALNILEKDLLTILINFNQKWKWMPCSIHVLAILNDTLEKHIDFSKCLTENYSSEWLGNFMASWITSISRYLPPMCAMVHSAWTNIII